MNRPRLLLIDEPTLGLSPKMFDEVFAHILRARSEGVTVLMVEQNAARALEISDHAFVLRLGESWMEGTGQAILNNPIVREQYLGGR
jgi:branched-chain amino acid transport system ATP-binding protein